MGNPSIFFSYARDNSAFVLNLAKRLKQEGLQVWLDQMDIPVGERWDSAIENALKKSNTLLVVLSPQSVTSHNVLDEVSFAIEEGKNVLPVLYQNCDIPFRLRRFQYVDFTGNHEKGFESLLSYLKAKQPVNKIEESTVKQSEKQQAKATVSSAPQQSVKKESIAKAAPTTQAKKVQEQKATKNKSLFFLLPLLLLLVAGAYFLTKKKKPKEEVITKNEVITAPEESTIEEVSSVVPEVDTEEDDWAKAVEQKSVEGFETYLSKHADGKYADQAKSNVEEIKAWEDATVANKVEHYLAYLSHYGKNGLFSNEVASKIEAAPDAQTGWLYVGRANDTEITSDRIFDVLCCGQESVSAIPKKQDVVKNIDLARRVYPTSDDTQSGGSHLPSIKTDQLGYVTDVSKKGSAVKVKVTFSR